MNRARSALSSTGCIPVSRDSGGCGVSPLSIAPRNAIPGRAAKHRVRMTAADRLAPRRAGITGGERLGGGLGVAHSALKLASSPARGAGHFPAALLGQALIFPRTDAGPLIVGREYPRVLARSPSGQPRLARPPAGTPNLHGRRRLVLSVRARPASPRRRPAPREGRTSARGRPATGTTVRRGAAGGIPNRSLTPWTTSVGTATPSSSGRRLGDGLVADAR